jgi:hypothetical protein
MGHHANVVINVDVLTRSIEITSEQIKVTEIRSEFARNGWDSYFPQYNISPVKKIQNEERRTCPTFVGRL